VPCVVAAKVMVGRVCDLVRGGTKMKHETWSLEASYEVWMLIQSRRCASHNLGGSCRKTRFRCWQARQSLALSSAGRPCQQTSLSMRM
jgi:hypothetical protein